MTLIYFANKLHILLFLSSLFFFEFVLSEQPSFIKAPIFWRNINDTSQDVNHNRRLHDYLSIFPTYGDSKKLGYFYSLVYVGNPPQRQTVILDTGSSIMAFPCSSCTSCGTHQNAPFNPSLSTTIKKVHCDEITYKGKCSMCRDQQCHFSQSYLEGSYLEGPLFWDTVWFGGNALSDSHIPVGDYQSASLYGVVQQFGCFTRLRGLFQKQLADGIIGLAPRDMSFVGVYEKHMGDLASRNPHNRLHNMFTMCFIEGGGFMTLGGVDETVLSEPLCHVSFSSLDRYFRVNVQSISVGDQRAYLDINKWNQRGGVMIDSGTTYTYIISSEYRVLVGALTQGIKTAMERHHVHFPSVSRIREHNCYRLRSEADLALFPVMHWEFASGCTLHVEARFYMFLTSDSVYCLGLHSDPSTVIGNNIMQGQSFVFDLEKKQLGVARSNISFE